MYDFHYNLIKENFDAELVFTDTNSLTYEIKFLMKSFWNTKISLNLVNINQNFLIQQIKMLLAKWKMNTKEWQTVNLLG